jgi:hypothetical protein
LAVTLLPDRYSPAPDQSNSQDRVELSRICIYVHVASVLSPFHHHSPAAFMFQRGVVNGWVDPAHNSVSTNADTHLPANHQSDAAEHFLFGNFDGGSKSNSHAV